MKYKDEIDYIVGHQKRNEFIRDLTLNLNKNTLVLFQLVEKHGSILYDMIKQKTDRKVFFVFGGTDTETREEIRSITEKQKDAIIVASYGTFSTGINIRNLHNIVFSSPSKSRIRTLQSIGRGLRKSDTKDSAMLFDIADDFTYKTKDSNSTIISCKQIEKISKNINNNLKELSSLNNKIWNEKMIYFYSKSLLG